LPKNSLEETDIGVVLETNNEEKQKQGSSMIVAEISGAVNKPGVYSFAGQARVVDLLGKAEGFKEEASEVWISRRLNLAAEISDAQKVYIPFKWDEEELIESTNKVATLVNTTLLNGKETVSSTGKNGNGEESIAEGERISLNVNTATLEELEELKGIGPSYAQRIIDNKPYEDLYELEEKSGVPVGTLEKIADSLSF
jgi:competence protein ComEA